MNTNTVFDDNLHTPSPHKRSTTPPPTPRVNRYKTRKIYNNIDEHDVRKIIIFDDNLHTPISYKRSTTPPPAPRVNRYKTRKIYNNTDLGICRKIKFDNRSDAIN